MSIWGVNQVLGNPVIATAGSDVACAAGTETNAISATTFTSFASMNSVLFCDVACVIVLGATPPSALVIAVRVGSGGDADSYTVSPTALVANAVLQLAPALAFVNSRGSANVQATLNVTVNPTGQAVTLKAGARALISYSLGADA